MVWRCAAPLIFLIPLYIFPAPDVYSQVVSACRPLAGPPSPHCRSQCTCADPEWRRLQAKAGASAVAIVTGADSGPPDPNSRDILTYDAAFKQLSDAGVGLAGYVSTSYGARPQADVIADIRAWYDQHSGQMSGIFLDEFAEKVRLPNSSCAQCPCEGCRWQPGTPTASCGCPVCG